MGDRQEEDSVEENGWMVSHETTPLGKLAQTRNTWRIVSRVLYTDAQEPMV